MAKKKEIIPKDQNIVDLSIADAMAENYLPYAVAVAKDRALPDVRDGLKPVHRRILYGAYQLKALPNKPYLKSARIVGDILGKYHPHGDSSVYDALVILAQDFSTYCPLIDGHGNFGSIDGDSAAAMRYTESRLSDIALEMLRDIDMDTVDFVPNYSDSDIEPVVLPARYPNLLVNGSFGIAVGLATNIPTHNLGETIDATCALIDNPNLTTKELLEYIKGPDLPTGGLLIGENAILSAYETGQGKIPLRANTSIETLENGRLAIIINEFPYKQNKAKILQSISDMTGDKKHSKNLESIFDIRDESDRNGIRAVIEFKKSATKNTVDKVLNYLLKKSNLQVNLGINMLAIANGKPETLSLKQILIHYITHQKDVITRRTQKSLLIAEKRFHVVEGFIKAISIMDEVIDVIRASKSKQDSQKNLSIEFGFSDVQAEAIVTLMLYRLTSLEITTFEKEYKSLKREIKKLKSILNKDSVLLELLKTELYEIKDKYSVPRKTIIVADEDKAKITVDDIIVDEDVIITQSSEGFIKRVSIKTYNRINPNPAEIDYREGDSNKFVYKSNTKDTILMFTETGLMYQVRVIDIPELKWKEKGLRLNEIVKSKGIDNETIVNVVSIKNFDDKRNVLFVTKQGSIKITPIKKLETNHLKTVATKLKKDDSIIGINFIDENVNDFSLTIKTKIGLTYKIQELIDEYLLDKNTQPINNLSLLSSDSVENIIFGPNYDKNNDGLYIGYDNLDELHISKDVSKYNQLLSKAYDDDILLFLSRDGKATTLSCSTLSENTTISMKAIMPNIIDVILIKPSFVKEYALFLFSNIGLIKKIKIEDILGLDSINIYKFKNDEEIVSASIGHIESSDLIIFTHAGMCLKFKANSFTATGRNAGGITGIRCKNDSVIGGTTFCARTVIRLNNKKKPIDTSSIAFKNKGTLGTSIADRITEFYIDKRSLI